MPNGRAFEVAVLGPLALAVDGHEVVVAGFRRRALLARLAVDAGSAVSADRLAEDLWEDDEAHRSLATLRTYVAKLRQLVPRGNELIESRPGGYALALAPDELDAGRVGDVLTRVDDAPAADAERTLLAALAEWRGGSYEEFSHLGWAQLEAARLDELRLSAQERLFDVQLALGRHAEVVPTLGALAAAHPLRERFQAQLAVALYRSGRQSDALAAQRRATTILRDELGLDPGPELADLERRLLQQDPSLAAPHRPAPLTVAAGSTALPPPLRPRRSEQRFVGRAPQIERLSGALDDVRRSGPRLVLLCGEPGIGKTRLAAVASSAALAQGATVLYGRCDDRLGVSFQPFVEALREAASRAPRDTLAARLGDTATALVPLIPELAAHVPAPPVAVDPTIEQLRLFDAVAAWLRSTAADAPVVLVLDDLQWATASTTMLTRHVMRALVDAGSPVLLLATARAVPATPVAELVADLRRVGDVEVIELGGLDVDAVAELVAAEASTCDVEHLCTATAGNPFIIGELLRNPGHLAADEVPPSIRDVLLASVRRLPEPAPAVLAVAAVAGVEFELPVLAAAAGRSEEETLIALDDAVAAGLLRELDGAAGRYGFVHGIVQRTVEDTHSAGRRARLHAAIATALESAGAQPDQIAHHWRAAGPAHVAAAAEWSASAGRRALGQLAYADAAGHLSAALAVAEDADPAWRSAVLLDLATAHARNGDAATARDAVLEAALVARATGDAVMLAKAALAATIGGRGVSSWLADATRRELLEEAYAALAGGDDPVLRIRVAGELALATYRPEARDRRHALGREAVALAEAAGSADALVAALPASRVAYWHPRDTASRLGFARSVLDVSRDNDPWATVDAVDWIAADCYEVGDRPGFDAAVAHALTLAAEIGGVVVPWRARVWEAVVATTAGRFEEAEAHAEAALACWGGDPAPDAVQAFGYQLSVVRLLQGRGAEAAALADQALASAPDNIGIHAPRAFALAAAGRFEEAAESVTRVAADGLDRLPQDSQWMLNVVTLSEAAVRLGDLATAEIVGDALGPYADRFAVLAGPGVVWGSVAHQLGALALALGRRRQAVEQLERACELERSFGADVWLARSEALLEGVSSQPSR